MERIIECVPNFSEGRDIKVIEAIVDVFRGRPGVKLLNYSSDKDHNRMVVTAMGEPEAMKRTVIEAIGKAVELIDLTGHSGEHPRIGAADVVPFIPIRNMTIEQTDAVAREVAGEVASRYGLPVYLYEKSAACPERSNLADIRKGGFEGLASKMSDCRWAPDLGPSSPHPTAGAVVIGARIPLIAFNINLNTDNVEIAEQIARRVRHIGGGLRFCKAMGVDLREKGMAQVSMNITDYTRTSLYRVFELVKIEARRYGVTIAGSELIGLIPLDAVVDTAQYYLGLEEFDSSRILETYLME